VKEQLPLFTNIKLHEHKLSQENLNQLIAVIVEDSTDFIAAFDSQGHLLYINQGGRKIAGISDQAEIFQSSIYEFYPAGERNLLLKEWIPTALNNGVWKGESVLLTKVGLPLPVFQTIIAHKGENKIVEFFSITARNSHEFKQAEKSYQLFAKVFESTQEGILITDADVKIQAVNPAFSIVTGYSLKEVLGQNPRILQSGKHDKVFFKKFWKAIYRDGKWQGEILNRRKNGEIFPVWLTINAVKDSNGTVGNYIGVFSDITSTKISEKEFAHLAHHDALTDLPNRILFYDRLELAFAHARRDKNIVAVMFIDLDHFKPINDSLGHQIGDLVLQHFARRLKAAVREGDTVARWGGDEFTLILENLNYSPDAAKTAQKILNAIAQPFLIEGQRLKIGASIGISLYPVDAANMGDLIKAADTAMYQSKQLGGNNYQFYCHNN
jgi:diguanylate cyclase (GGDEF)-like protein/PAS domain S-box-containing protein